MKKVVFDTDLIKKYDISGPRYTSYPTAPQFKEDFGEKELKNHLLKQQKNSKSPISLYFHLPFCADICYFCACNKVITKDRTKAETYIDYLFGEIEQKLPFLSSSKVSQIHFGGGTPTFFNNQQLEKLIVKLKKNFIWEKDGEFSVETDPREIKPETIKILSELGFNRMSFGVQDFSLPVQKAVNRIQPYQLTLDMVLAAREYGFGSINLDLMYGLPLQNVKQFEKTLIQTLTISPDRISLFNYAHLPHLFKPQRRINQIDLPQASIKLDMFKLAIETLQDNGYVYIGMDHFAKPSDQLAICQKQGKLNRNFQGYSTYPDCDLYAFGVSAISKIGLSYSQNQRNLDDYYQKIDDGQFALFRGYELNFDDCVRSQIIREIMCNFKLDFDQISNTFSIDSKEYFSEEIEQLKQLAKDDLLYFKDQSIVISAKGRILVRIVAMVFDAYLANKKVSYSKAI